MTIPLDIAFAAVGKPLQRKEDERLITGKGRFTDDFCVDGETYMAVVRSPHPHARIVAIDTAAAKAMPGVLTVLTGADSLADGMKPIPHSPLPSTKYDMKLTAPDGTANAFFGPHHMLAVGRTRYVGEAVALVVAETKAQAQDAAEAVDRRLCGDAVRVLDRGRRSQPGAPAVWDEVSGNTLIETWFGDKAATDRAFAAADHVTSMDFHIQPRHGRADGIALVPCRLRPDQRPLHALCRLRRRGAAEGRACRRRSASSRISCACCPSTSAAISARATGPIRNSAW